MATANVNEASIKSHIYAGRFAYTRRTMLPRDLCGIFLPTAKRWRDIPMRTKGGSECTTTSVSVTMRRVAVCFGVIRFVPGKEKEKSLEEQRGYIRGHRFLPGSRAK